MSGSRSGLVLGAASVGGIVLNYAFLLASGRLLGTDEYGELAAIIGVLTVVLLPTSALQMAVSRDVSRRLAVGDVAGAHGFSRAVLRVAVLATVPLLAVFYVVLGPLAHLLSIESAAALAIAGASLATTFALPTLLGIVQGEQRFVTLGLALFVPFAVRLAVLGLVALAGATIAGVAGAVFASSLAGLAVAFAGARDALSRGRGDRPELRSFFRYLVPVVVGLLGMSVLVNLDVIVVNARFTDHEASLYAAAAAFARVGYFLPTTILSVLFPRTAARQARGEETADILGRSLIVTAVFCLLLSVGYELLGQWIMTVSFGPEFDGASDLLALFALEIGVVSLANVLVGFHLSRGETRFAWIVAASIPVEALALATIPDSLKGVIWVNVAVGLGLLATHELTMGSTVPALRAGARRLVGLS
jgi:O-antigen/teichoic acid export membrane protein